MAKVKFSDFIDAVLEPLSTVSSAAAGTDVGQFLRVWLRRSINEGIPLFTWLSLLLPEEDVDRKYHIQQKTLAKLLIPIFGWIGTAKAAQLERWQEPLLDNDRSAGDFSLRLELLCDSLQDEAASRSPCTVTSVSADDRRGLSLFDIQTALDELATYCPFSNIPASTRSSLAVRRTQTEILTVLFTGGRSPKECRWLCRILLKDMKLALECSRLLNAIDYRLGEVYKVRNLLPIASRHFEAIFRANVNLRSAAERDKWLTPEMGINIAIMSSQKCTGLADIYKNYSGQIVAVETKYDGERLQVHMFTGADGNFMIRVFNKSKRDATQERQNAHEIIKAGFGIASDDFYTSVGVEPSIFRTRRIQVDSVVAEGEIVVFDERTQEVEMFGTVRNFEPSSAEYKHFKIIWFDLLMLNGRSLLGRPYHERRHWLERIIKPIDNYISIAAMRPFSLSCELFAEQFARYYSDLVFAGRQEGVILKPWNSSYVPGAKSFWMKLKRVYIKGLGDTADFAVIGACLSKQTSFKFTANQQRLGGIIGSFIIACLENKQELRKPFTRAKLRIILSVENGLSELQRHQFHAKALSRLISISSPSENRSSGISLMAAVQSLSYDLIFGKSAINKSDIKYLFDPPFVFELLGDEFVKEFGDSYYSLRHPRIIRMRRDMDWKETLSFEEYQQSAVHSLRSMDPAQRDRAKKKMGASIMATRQNSDLTQLMSLLSTEQYIVFFNDYIPTAKLSSFAGESCAEDVDIGLNTDSSQRIDLLIPRQKIVHSLSALLISIGCRPCGHSGTRQATVKSAIIISTGSAASIQETLLREFQAINCHVWMVICSKLLSNSCTKEWLNVQLNSFDMMRVMR